MQDKNCPHGHSVLADARVCVTCGWIFALPPGTYLGAWKILESQRRHDRYFYRVTNGSDTGLIAETLEYFQAKTREKIYQTLNPMLAERGQAILDYGHWQAENLQFLHTRYTEDLWPIVQTPLRSQLDQTGILAPEDLVGLFQSLQSLGIQLQERKLLNPSLTSLLTGKDAQGQWRFLEWEYCVFESQELLYPRYFLGYHSARNRQEKAPEAYHFHLMRSALRALLLESITGSSPVEWYPEPLSIQAVKVLLSTEFRRWLEDFETAPDPRRIKNLPACYSSDQARQTLQKSSQLFAEGYALFQAGKLQNALPSFEQACRQHLLFSQAYRFQALCLRSQDYPTFLRLIDQALRSEERACFYYEKAQGHILNQKIEKAASDLLRAIAIAPYYPEAWYLLGSCQERMSQFNLAEAAYKKAWQQRHNPRFKQALAELFEKQGLPEQAKKYRQGTLSSGTRARFHTETAQTAETILCRKGHRNSPEQAWCQRCMLPLGLEVGDQIQGYTILECLKHRNPDLENFNSVYRAQTEEGVEVLLKEQFIPAAKRQDFLYKYEYLLKIQHDYIQNIQDVFLVEPYGYLIYPWQKGETLQDYLERKGAAPEQTVWQILITVASVIIHLQALDPPLVHGDIKPGNILLTETGDIKLFDLDSFLAIPPDFQPYQPIATFPYAPPEQENQHQVNQTSDSYALGITLMAALTGIFPEIFLSFGRKRFLKWENSIPHISVQLKNIINELTYWDIHKRSLLSREKLRPWLQDFKNLQPLPVPEKFKRFQAAFWAVHRAKTEQLDEKIRALLQIETSRITLHFCASRLYQENKLTEALQLLRNIQSFGTVHENSLWLLGELYLNLGYFKSAVEVLNQSLDSCKDKFWPYILLARSYIGLKQDRLTLVAYEQAQRRNASSGFVLEYISVLFEKMYFQEALDKAQKHLLLTDLPHERAFLHGISGKCLSSLNLNEEALKELQESLRWQAEQPAILFEAGKICLRLSQPEQARFYLKGCLEQTPTHHGARFYLARAEIESKNFETGLEILNSLKPQTHEDRVDLRFQKARVLTLMQRFDEAEACYQELKELAPCEAVSVNFGNLCLILHKYEKAQALFQEALGFNPDSFQALHGLKLLNSLPVSGN
ncbi:hypothetical protein COW36_03405 [bacterium (Candidatus Blackallbacteria) CG17_big_fil_post_rev_8_21_14_2_50_48_46]|uniref:non-specific serine/threonine protein kinase n=1 Tax=bacterium (Candidatus Blackallbacteria) CG17_big_fil_post_rev_8_21_14_2_50_48_46 TaxID=2014261 RepID=A0A2M7G9I6_9BACT|nr:MAG: hypothetical protein COW64_06520 [bacterium (Candidatus Blackallbacteria) CG18_big_fil_WC_8_21_14_2_50_49_26]PIW18795.1 MAG: hypothetical protein COW36_03405 [bacterium (Candidatus Blackallbacteria) CG17_big_fil_post_rev_8_21_14_2_50_48_46]PIW47772.1 MAG: hypothetical protein COW20_11370 [bacterium (Candidatus Blackallbacteria) CG13_big_fil_rev_8_21_14_2_50_49_14]